MIRRPRLVAFACILTLAICAPAPADAQEPFLQLVPQWPEGAAQGREFGLIVDMAVRANGHVYVLDSRAPALVELNAEGHVAAVVEGRGGGPSEFRRPQELALTDEGVVVLDAGQGNLRWFSADRGLFKQRDSWIPPINLRSFCMMGESIVGLGLRVEAGTAMFFIFDGRRELTTQFGLPADATTFPVPALARGRILCLEDQRTIVFLPDLHGRVFALSESGKLLWTRDIPGYEQVEVDSGTGWVRFSAPEGHHDRGAALAAYDGHIIVQHARVDPGSPQVEEASEVRTTILSLVDGSIVATSGRLPRIAASRGRILVGYTNSLVPAPLSYMGPEAISRERPGIRRKR